MARLVGLVVLAVLCVALRGVAFAQNPTPSGGACGDEVERWIARCNEAHEAGITEVQCPTPGLFVFAVGDTRVEVLRDPTRGFRRAGPWGVSPVGVRGEWEALPSAQREAFSRVVGCVRGDDSLPVLGRAHDDRTGAGGTDDHEIHGTRTDHEDHTGRGGTDDHEIHGTRTDHEDHTGDGGTDDHEVHGTRTDHEDHTGDGGTDSHEVHGTRTDHEDHSGRGGTDNHEDHTGRGRGGAPTGTSKGSVLTRLRLHLPWRILAACALLAWSGWPQRTRRRARVKALAVVAVMAAVVIVRWSLFTPTFFHQNGQGPFWLDAVLRGEHPYGPGYAEVFSVVLGLSPAHPEAALFLVQSILAAASVCAAWALARRSGVSHLGAAPVSAALALGLAVNPTLGRIATSESYFALALSLDLLGAWALTLATPLRGDVRAKLRALAPTVAGGLLLSLAVAVHPVAWLPSAMIPMVLAVGPGGLRRRLRRTALAYAVVGVVVAVTALPGVLAVLHGELGQRWTGGGHGQSLRLYPDQILRALTPWIGVLVVLLATVRRPVRVLPRMLVCFVVAAAIEATDVVTASGTRAALSWAFFALHAPLLVAVFSAALSDLPRTRRQATVLGAALALGGILFAAKTWAPSVALPTDARELTALITWRERIPANARVAALTRAGRHVLAFPLYPLIDPRGRELMQLRAPDGEPPSLRGAGYWYHSSLCSTVEGRAYCDAIERGLSLEPVATAVHPALWSLSHLPYDAPRIPVGLYRVRAPSP